MDGTLQGQVMKKQYVKPAVMKRDFLKDITSQPQPPASGKALP